MIKKAEKQFRVNLSDSALIGDNITDIQAGLNAGVKKNILLDPNNTITFEPSNKYVVVSSLEEASILL